MNVLFLTLLDFTSIQEHTIYTDLLREFHKNGHHVYAVSPVERRKQSMEQVFETPEGKILKLSIGNITRTNLIEKGISTLQIESRFIQGLKRYFGQVRFDLVLYSTPPITFGRVVEFVKKRDGARAYLLLKDIFPQNAVDLGMLKKSGLGGILYRYFRKKEKKLYQTSDTIGCMSQANVDYVRKQNPWIDPKKVEICANSVQAIDMGVDQKTRERIRRKYQIPLEQKVFVYGGNLGKPQGIEFFIECLRQQEKDLGVYFLIIGDGTEYGKLKEYITREKPEHVTLMKRLPREDYEAMVGACDVGLIFLDHRFTIPNFPSRILSYMQAGLPVLAVTDVHTDVGKVITEGKFGWWCESNSTEAFGKAVQAACGSDLEQMGNAGFRYLAENYSVEDAYRVIMRHWE
ncbi:MAG: glycosyltransferase family 4 protein [Lachnospiraceae bacterium]|nr:glycosyltransferase family 4 protein [Lachnospiraceae bacterium]